MNWWPTVLLAGIAVYISAVVWVTDWFEDRFEADGIILWVFLILLPVAILLGLIPR